MDFHKPGHFGWVNNPLAVEQTMATMPKPLFGEAVTIEADIKTTLLYDYYQKVTGGVAPPGPQGIGDCVSWDWSNLVNYLQVTTILDKLNLLKELNTFLEYGWQGNTTLEDFRNSSEYTFEEIASEAVYGFSRVEVGQQHGSYQDGSVGAWAAKAATNYGHLTRKAVGTYDPQRAKSWGAKGVPDQFEPEAKLSVCKVASLIRTVEEAKHAICNLKIPVSVCSDQGFSMTRDINGACRAQGTWYHAMLTVGYRLDLDMFCLSQSWGKNTPNGPISLNQPDNTFWIASSVFGRMLSQGDSHTADTFNMYKNRKFIDWSH